MDLENRFIELTLPEAKIDGLYFNKQKISAVFHKQEDGWWQAEDILFMSARNAEDDNSRDILTEYLNDFQIRAQIAATFNVSAEAITVGLPWKSRGIKQYHGVDWSYWLANPYSMSVRHFWNVLFNGLTDNRNADVVLGCAPAFRVNEEAV
jgi:hypothetical protein